MPELLSGILVADKPAGPTSHDVVRTVRRFLGTRAGHTGTLDPMATGVLPVTLGRATRLTRFFQDKEKEYLAGVELGKVTDTYDGEGRVLSERPVPPLSRVEVEDLLLRFRGEIVQLPPMYSAVKVGGKRLYQLARRQQEVERPARRVRIHKLEIIDCSREHWKLRIQCSAGTYIRTLAHDLGQALGCGAYLAELRRTRAGSFDLSRAVPLAELEERWREGFYCLEELLPEFPRLDLGPEEARRVSHGAPLDRTAEERSSFYRLFHEGRLVALASSRDDDERLQPIIVLGAYSR